MDNILEILIAYFCWHLLFGNMFSGESDRKGSPSIPSGRGEELRCH